MILKKFEEQVELSPANIAVKSENKSLAYYDLDDYANRVANEIITGNNKRENGAEQRVSLLFEHGVDMIVGVISALKAGRIYVPFDASYPLKRLAYMLENSGSHLILTNSKNFPLAQKLVGQVSTSVRILNIESISSENIGSNRIRKTGEAAGGKLAYILYTSGSTGRPKGVVQTHRNVLYYIRNWVERFSITASDRMTLFSAFSHDGAEQDIFAALLTGACLFPYSIKIDSDPDGIYNLLKKEKITVWHSVPSLFRYFTGTLTGNECFNDIRWVLLGGEPLRPHDLELFKTHFPKATLANVYGQTESSVNSFCIISREDTFDEVSIGEPLDETDILLVNKDGDVVEEMGVGEIVVASDYIAPGYWQDKENSETVFIQNDELGHLYLTGDMGRLTGRSTIKITGRKDYQAKVRGFRVEIGEIETSLLQMEGIREAVVIPKETEASDTYLCAFIVSRQELKVSELRDFLSRELPDYMIPSSFVQLESMPFTQSGKIDRRALAELDKESLRLSVPYVAPQTAMEKMVADTWKEVLKLEQVGLHDNIFDLGGNSFDIVKINNKLAGLLKRNIPIVKLFEYTTIDTLAHYLNQQENDGTPPEESSDFTEKRQKREEPGRRIAVIGMAGRFPGASSIREFWENIKNGVESISFFSDEELKESGIEADSINKPNYVRAKGMLADIEFFDASFFNFTPREAEVMDPQICMFLECIWEALEHAAYNPYEYNGLIGLYAGNVPNYYWQVKTFFNRENSPVGPFETMLLTESFSTRVAYQLNLTGPCISVRTACSTSLVAIHLACQGLLCRECDMALAGGASITLPSKSGYLYQEGMLLSADGHIRAFDARAKGTIFGDGVGSIVLKRLDDALADGDCIHAVILGSAINNDGIRKVGYTAPSIRGQADVIKSAHLMAGVEPESIDFIEAHGTGTILGDPVEIEALKKSFHKGRKGSPAIGSVKANVGHLNAAAGVAGFIKTVLCLENKLIPPSINFEIPNPEIDFENIPFYVNTKLSEWKNDKYPLRAGVSSFGLGGTNAHVVLEEAPLVRRAERKAQYALSQRGDGISLPYKSRDYQLILLSARNSSALDKATQNLLDHFKENPHLNLADTAYTLQVGRRAFEYRRMLVCSDIDDAIDILSSPDTRKVKTSLGKEVNPPIIFMFPGLGSQYVKMGWELYNTEPVFHEEMNRCFEILKPLLGYDIKEILYPGDEVNAVSGELQDSQHSSFTIHHFEVAQLVIFVFEYALARLLMKWGINPQAMIGYSFGEYIAACLSGVFSLEEALKVVVLRGQLIKTMPGGAMLSVPLTKDEIKPGLNNDLSIAIDNGPSCIISGPEEAIEIFEQQMKEKKYLGMRLQTSHGLHSNLMAPVLAEFEKQVGQITLKSPQIPYISNVTGNWISAEEAIAPAYWAKHLSSTVHFAAGMKKLLNEENSVFIEVGPGRDLSTLIQRYTEDKPGYRILSLVRHSEKEISDVKFLLNKIGYLWLWGKKINWDEFHPGEKPYRLSLPTYPFERQRFWLEETPFKIGEEVLKKFSLPGKKDISDWFYLPSWKPSFLSGGGNEENPGLTTWLVFIDECEVGDRLVKHLEEDGQDIVTVKKGLGYAKENARAYTINPKESNDYKTLFRELTRLDIRPGRIVHLWSVIDDDKKGTRLEWMEKCQDLGYYSLIFLVRAIEYLGPDEKLQITVVSNNMQGIYGEDLLYPEKATLLGPVNVIPKEYQNIRCRSVDITWPGPPGSHPGEKTIRQLLGELKSNSPDPIVVYHSGNRLVPAYEPVKLEKPLGKALRLKEKGVYLITGGLGDIGLLQAEYLARRVKARLILTGRSDFPARQHWEQWLCDHQNGEDNAVGFKIKKLLEIEKLGGEVLVFSADVSHQERMEEVISRAEKQFGPINGVIHNALQIDGGVIHLITREMTENVFASKVKGTLVLDTIFKKHQLDFFILSSSTASIMMGIGHVAYGGASAFLDAFAQHNTSIGNGVTMSINWTAWSEVGGALKLAKEHAKSLGFSETPVKIEDGILSADGIEAFSMIMESEPAMAIPQVVVYPQDLIKQISLSKTLSPRKSIASMKISSREGFQRPQLDSEYVAPRNDFEQILVDIWSEFFGFEQIGIRDDFFELGGDSLKAIGITLLIEKKLDVKVSIVTIFNKTTIEEVAKYIEESAKESSYSPITPVEEKEYYKISSAQKRLYILQQMEPSSTAYNILQIFGLEGKLTKFKRAFNQLIKRHESCRTSFWLLEEEPVQRVSRDLKFAIEYYHAEVERNSRNNPLTIHDYMQMPGIADIVTNFIQPFDLSRAPLIRVGLIKLAETNHILMVDMHHIISDEISLQIFIKEFIAFYQGEDISESRIQYKDFSQWQNAWLDSEGIKKQEEYWLKCFAEEITLLTLPYDFSRPVTQTYAGKNLKFMITLEQTQQLKQLARENETTLFIVLLAVFNLLLSKLSGQEDIVVGSPVAGRRHPDLLSVIGIFINTLTLRNYPAPDKYFDEFLSEVKENSLDAFENQDYQYEELVEKVLPPRDLGRNPLFDVMLVLQNIDRTEIGIDVTELKLSPYNHESHTSKFDLSLLGVEAADKLVFMFEYSIELFTASTIGRFISYFKKLISDILLETQKDIKLSEIEIISAEEKRHLLFDFNDTETEYPKDKTLHRLFEEQVERTPDHTALLGLKLQIPNHKLPTNPKLQTTNEKSQFPMAQQDMESGYITITYSELNVKSDRLAHLLIEGGGVPGTIVGVMVERSVEMIIGIFGILKAGGIYLPIDPEYPRDRIDYMLKDSGAKLLVTTRALVEEGEKVRRWEGEKIFLEPDCCPGRGEVSSPTSHQDVVLASPFAPSASTLTSTCQVSSANLAYIIYTSGSTGKPKGVIIGHWSLVNFIMAMSDIIDLRGCDRVFSLTTISFDIFGLEVYLPLTYGLPLLIGSREEQLDAEAAAKTMRLHHITILQVTPSRLTQWLTLASPAEALRYLNYLLLGGEALPLDLLEKTREILRGKIYNLYGPTESTIWSTAKDLTHKVPLNIGKPIANNRIYILDSFRKLVIPGGVGELYIGGEGVSPGYLNNPGLTAEKFVRAVITDSSSVIISLYSSHEGCDLGAKTLKTPGTITKDRLYRTGDLGRWLPDGNIEFLGRIDSQVKIRGFRIELGEIENRLLSHKEIKECAVTVREGEKGNKYLCAYLVVRSPLTSGALREYLSKYLPDYMNPSYFMMLDKMPLTPNGKIDLKALPEPGLEAGTGYTAPRDEVEMKLVEIWSGVLGIEKHLIGIDSNFFELGGHSLNAMILIARIHKEMDVKLPLAEIFKTPTIRKIARYIQNSRKSLYTPIEPAEEKKYYALSSAQKRLYILQEMELENTTYNMPYVLHLKDGIDLKQLEEAFRQLIARYENLRMSFEMVDGVSVQKVHDEVDFEIEFYDAQHTTQNAGPGGNFPWSPPDERLAEIIENFIRPFDLSHPPLMRVGLIKLLHTPAALRGHPRRGTYSSQEGKEDRYLLMVDMHHITTDGISQGILINDLRELYLGEQLPEINIQYKDYVVWQNERRKKGAIKKQEEYWLKQFEKDIPQLNLPTDFRRPEVKSFNGDTVKFTLGKKEADAIKAFASQSNTTLYIFLLSVYYVLLSKLSGAEDIVVGCAGAGRRHPDLQQVVGIFINTLALRNYPSSEKKFEDFLAEVKTRTLEAFENQEYPFESLVERVCGQRDMSRHPLIDVGFTQQNFGPQPGDRGEDKSRADHTTLWTNSYDFKRVVAKIDLNVEVYEIEGQELLFVFQYAKDLFKKGAIEMFAGYFRQILATVKKDLRVRIKDIQLMSEQEKKEIHFGIKKAQEEIQADFVF